MFILQALFALITRSAGKILNAVFGWAVHALFGKTTSRDQTMLSALVGAAVAWPLLAAGVVAPKVAALALAFVPLPKSVPAWIVRLVWLALALAVPVVLGLAIAARRPPQVAAEPTWKRVLRGFPLTLGLALAFLVMFISVPVMRLVALARREKSSDVPLVTDTDSYHEVASRIIEALNRHGFELRAAEPGWWVKAPTRILALFGGTAFAGFVPQTIEHYEGPGLTVSFYTSGVLLRGKGTRQSWAHGLIGETAVHSRGFETFAAPAQALERQIRQVWTAFDELPRARGGPARGDVQPLLARLEGLARALTNLEVDYDDWQVLYRQLLQVERALRGERQLMDDAAGEVPPAREAPKTLPPRASSLSTAALVTELGHEVEALVKAHLTLARAELRRDLVDEKKMVAGLGVSAVAALVTLNLLFVSAALALAAVMPAWAAGLTVAGVTLAATSATAAFGWHKRVREPLALTRRALAKDLELTKGRTA